MPLLSQNSLLKGQHFVVLPRRVRSQQQHPKGFQVRTPYVVAGCPSIVPSVLVGWCSTTLHRPLRVLMGWHLECCTSEAWGPPHLVPTLGEGHVRDPWNGYFNACAEDSQETHLFHFEMGGWDLLWKRAGTSELIGSQLDSLAAKSLKMMRVQWVQATTK
jgi:hypothetical protein